MTYRGMYLCFEDRFKAREFDDEEEERKGYGKLIELRVMLITTLYCLLSRIR